MLKQEHSIEVNNLTKYYGPVMAIHKVSFNVGKGEIVGFLGPNGAGKSTTMRILSGLITANSGSAKICGIPIASSPDEIKKHIGYMAENNPLPEDMRVVEYLYYRGWLKEIPRNQLKARVEETLDLCDLNRTARRKVIANLSKGYRQRVGISQAILHEPDVLVLDEPTIGIDPIQVVETRQLIKDLGEDHTLILSSHILPEVSMICDRVIIIHEGQIVAVDDPTNLGTNLAGVERVELEVKGPNREIMPALELIGGVQVIERVPVTGGAYHRYHITVDMGKDLRHELATMVVNSGWELLKLQSLGMSLEEIFLRLTIEEEQLPNPTGEMS